MGGLKEFIIPFVGLKDGDHEFEFGIGNSFFEAFPLSEITKGEGTVKVNMIKRPYMLTFDMELNGLFELPCDRCGNIYRQDLSGQWQLVVNLNGETFNDEDDLITLPAGSYEIDLSQYVYEYMNLLLPSRRVCADPPDPAKGNCDPETIAKLDELKPKDENDNEKRDPRWDALKDLL
jgi:uncharacterized metal-binding protein YceD (DUF177 family)